MISVSDVPSEDAPEVDWRSIAKGLSSGMQRGPFEILDIREPYEYRQGHLRPSVLIPMNDIPEQLSRFDKSVTMGGGLRSWNAEFVWCGSLHA